MKHTVFEHALPGGASGLVIDVPESDVVSLQVRFNSGFQFADRSQYEVPHVMEHLLATVTKRHPGPNEFYIEAQKNGAYVNATTSVDTNGYVYECADFELDRILDLVEEQLAEPLFVETPLKAELGNVKEELTRNTTQHGNVCAVRLAEAAFPHLWLDYDERIQQLSGIGIDAVRLHYERTHTAANARFYVAGHFPDGGAKLVERLGKIFDRLPRGERMVRSGDMGLNLSKPVVTQRDIQQLYYRATMYFGELNQEERRALTLLRMVLVGGMGSRVLGEARQRGLAYSVGGLGYAEPGNSSYGFVGYVTAENAEPLFELMAREYAAVRAEGPSTEELEAAKDLVVGSIKRSTQTSGDILSWYIEPYDESGDVRHFDQELELLRKVTPADVVAVAQKASAEKRQGFSFVGQLDERKAGDFAKILAGLWG